MNDRRPFAVIILPSLACDSGLSGQDKKAANLAAATPNLVLIVHQKIQKIRKALRPSRTNELEQPKSKSWALSRNGW